MKQMLTADGHVATIQDLPVRRGQALRIASSEAALDSCERTNTKRAEP